MSSDPLLERAEILLPTANLCATILNEIIEDNFPTIRPADSGHWNYVVTIAAAFVANSQLLGLQVEHARKQRLMAKLIEQYTQWDSRASVGFEHCKTFFERTCDALGADKYNPQSVASDAIGLWLARELLDRAPTNEDERRLARIMGTAITREFSNWWNLDTKK